MKKLNLVSSSLAIIFFVSVLVSYTACKKETACNLATADTAPVEMDIVFKAVNTGDGAISTLTYTVGTKSLTVTDPNLPWAMTVSALSGDAISITANATTKDGSLTISYKGSSGGHEIEGSDQCSHSN